MSKAPISKVLAEDVARPARLLTRAVASGALATVRRGAQNPGHPYVSKVGVAADWDGQPLFLFSTLAAHTQDVLADARCSLLIEAVPTRANPLEAARVTLVGRAMRLDGDAARLARAVYLARHPGAARYVDFGDFSFWRLAVDKFHYVGGFGVAKWGKGADYRGADGQFAAQRTRLLDDANGPRQADWQAVSGRKRGWRAVDVDPDGLTLAGPKGRIERLDFPTVAKTPRSWRAQLAAGAKRIASSSQ